MTKVTLNNKNIDKFLKRAKKELTKPEPVYSGEIGNPIYKVEQIIELAQKGQSIFHMRWGRPVPAAFMQNMQAYFLVGQIRMGWLFHYKPKSKK